MNKNRVFIGFIALVLVASFSCQRNPLKIDVSNVDIDLRVHRFDTVLFNIPVDSIADYVLKLEEDYGEFFDIYNRNIINIGGTNSIEYSRYLRQFLTHYVSQEANQQSKKVFTDFSDVQAKLTQAFKHYNYYFPEREIPEVYTYTAGFNQSVITAKNILGIGLDKYLGEKCESYDRLGLEMYRRVNMNREMIPSDCMMAWAYAEFAYNDSIDNLLSNMIYKGKVKYFVDAMMPDEPENLKMGFTTDQLKRCKSNESAMWTYFVENKLLFSTDMMEFRRYTDVGPFTSTFTKESPAQTGVWMGWQIVKSYMKNNTGETLMQLMQEDDCLKILNLSRYNPA